ncbi:MAG: aldose 1-epimerase family protein [Clostridiaceae bacterium]|nr:aldose 1-epimerase family protein [Clostridiaceae bacterium]
MICTIENENLEVRINSLGAELWSIVDKNDGTEYLWQGDKELWARRAPNLFPHCGRLKNNKYTYENKTYKSEIHGFVKEFEHRVIEKSEASIVFEISDSEKTLKMYPWRFNFRTGYKLEGSRIIHSYEVYNPNAKDMYFSIGYHTGFMCPFDSGRDIEEYILKFEKKETPIEIICNDKGLLSGEERIYFENEDTIELHNKLFSSSIVLTNLKSDYISIVEQNTGRSVKVGIKDFPYLVLWSTPDVVKFVCIEPWYGLPDAHDTDGQFVKKRGIQKLAPDSTFRCSMTIDILP